MPEAIKGKSNGIFFKLSDEERDLIEQKMALAGITNRSAYIRKKKSRN